jgi:RNA polymerase sigma-70 factor (ECF subfamily)
VELPDTLTLSNDEELLARFRRGVSDAFGVLLRRYERELYGYLRRYLGDDTLAEDVFQNTFLQVYQKSGQFQVGRAVRPWLYAIATNQAIDALRRQGRHQAVSLEQAREATGDGEAANLSQALQSDRPGPLDLVSDAETREQVRCTVDRLPDNLRHVLILAYYQGLKYREIADIVSIPVGTVKSRLHAALAKFHEMWSAAVTSIRT